MWCEKENGPAGKFGVCGEGEEEAKGRYENLRTRVKLGIKECIYIIYNIIPHSTCS